MEIQIAMYQNVDNTDFRVFGEKSQNIMDVSEKCVVIGSNPAGERFDSVLKNWSMVPKI